MLDSASTAKVVVAPLVPIVAKSELLTLRELGEWLIFQPPTPKLG